MDRLIYKNEYLFKLLSPILYGTLPDKTCNQIEISIHKVFIEQRSIGYLDAIHSADKSIWYLPKEPIASSMMNDLLSFPLNLAQIWGQWFQKVCVQYINPNIPPIHELPCGDVMISNTMEVKCKETHWHGTSILLCQTGYMLLWQIFRTLSERSRCSSREDVIPPWWLVMFS